MVKAILPIAVGAVLGALAVNVLLRSERAGNQPIATIGAGNLRTANQTEFSASSSDSNAARAGDGSGPTSRPADAALPPIESVNFRIDAIVALGKQNTRGALASAMQLSDPEQRRLALRRLAQSLAEQDPLGAVSNLDAIDSAALESDFMVALLNNWAIVDPDEALAFLENPGDVRIPLAERAFDLLAERDPERLLGLTDGLVGDVRTKAIDAAFGSLIERDPLAALSRVGQLAPGSNRSALERAVATGYGKKDPDEAWRWVNATNATADTRLLVLAGIQSVDPARALDLAMADLTSTDPDRRAQMRQRVGTYLYSLRDSATSDDIAIALDRILSVDSSLAVNVQQFLGTWADDDPEAALDWSLQNLDRLDAGRVLTSIGRGLARTNPDRVRQVLFQLPEDDRASWVTGVGRALAENDVAAAREWAYEFPRGPLRDAALHEYVTSVAYGGSVDAQIFDQFSSDAARGQAAGDVAFRLTCNGHTALASEIASTQIADPDLLELTESRMGHDAAGGPNSLLCRFRQ